MGQAGWLAAAQHNWMNDESIFVNEAGSNQASSEFGAPMCQDEIARLSLQPDDFLREITARHCGSSPGLQDCCARCGARPSVLG